MICYGVTHVCTSFIQTVVGVIQTLDFLYIGRWKSSRHIILLPPNDFPWAERKKAFICSVFSETVGF